MKSSPMFQPFLSVKSFLGALALIGCLTGLLASPALSQSDVGYLEILQGTRQTGALYVPAGQDRCRYIEHWFLFEDYVYPGGGNGRSFTVQEVENRFVDLEDFLRTMQSEHPRGTHIEVFSAERRPECS